jgi:hypothetical protein
MATQTSVLEHKGDLVGSVLGSQCDNIVIASTLDDLGHASHVDAEGEVAVASVRLERITVECQ